MPETFNTAGLFGRITLLKKIEDGPEQIRKGKAYTTDEARKKLKK